MGDRIRSSLFNILGDLSGMTVLDAFAGSGSLGFEALSRGAAGVTFIERDRAAQAVIEKNIDTLGVESRAKLIRGSVAAWDETAGAGSRRTTICSYPQYFGSKTICNRKGL
jgi:16S rRNA (guanine966-N2)-methyltransferase